MAVVSTPDWCLKVPSSLLSLGWVAPCDCTRLGRRLSSAGREKEEKLEIIFFTAKFKDLLPATFNFCTYRECLTINNKGPKYNQPIGLPVRKCLQGRLQLYI